MMASDKFRYDGKRVLVLGGATGMGAAAAKVAMELGAEVIVLDVADVTYPVSQTIKIDLRDRNSIDTAIGQLNGPIHALFSCAGVADGTRGLILINYISQRYIIDRLVENGLLGRGSAIALISSVAGLGWQANLPTVLEFLKQKEWDSATAWIANHEGTDSYAFSKQAINAYVAHEAFPLLKKGVRVNAILPGPTDTPLARANADVWLGFGAGYRKEAGVEPHSPEQMGNALAFLCSDAAAGINGITLLVDYGHVGAGITGAFDEPAIKMLTGTA